MDDLRIESEFFHEIAPSVISLVEDGDTETSIAEYKTDGDYATQMDIDVENLIITELCRHFPDDLILAEERHADTSITDGRMWLIDPICGTSNLGKGINNFCTNIALAYGNQMIASCVVDHSQGEYFWSVGEGTVFVNDTPVRYPAPELGLKIDVDFGSARSVGSEMRQKHNSCLLKLINDTDYSIISLNASLGFAYTAIGKTDGFINVFNHPWDIAAAAFLVQQAGGVVSGIDGLPWTISTVGAIGGRTPEIQRDLLDTFVKS